jgi:hypothetical protein
MKREAAAAIGVGVTFVLLGGLVWLIDRSETPPAPAPPPVPPTPGPASSGIVQTGGPQTPLGTNTEIEPGLSTWPLENGKTYRLSGALRSGATVQQAEGALMGAGMGGYVSFGALPSDWPEENLPPLSKDEIRYRGEGAWRSSGELPTAFAFSQDGKTALIIEEVWEYDAAGQTTS